MTERELFTTWLKKQPDYTTISGYERIVMWKAWEARSLLSGTTTPTSFIVDIHDLATDGLHLREVDQVAEKFVEIQGLCRDVLVNREGGRG